MLILVGIGLALFVLRIFGIGWLQYGWVLALSICLVAFGLYLVHYCEASPIRGDTAKGFRQCLNFDSAPFRLYLYRMSVTRDLRRRAPRSCSF